MRPFIGGERHLSRLSQRRGEVEVLRREVTQIETDKVFHPASARRDPRINTIIQGKDTDLNPSPLPDPDNNPIC